MADDGLAVVTRLAERTMKANWAALLAAVPDMSADLVRLSQTETTVAAMLRCVW